jgi:hypothetical protein
LDTGGVEEKLNICIIYTQQFQSYSY